MFFLASFLSPPKLELALGGENKKGILLKRECNLNKLVINLNAKIIEK